MDDTLSFARSVRPSALPRPSHSRLPLPRSATTRGISPERSDSRLEQSFTTSTTTSPTKSILYTGSLRGRPSMSLLPTPSRPASQLPPPSGTIRGQSPQRQPLGTIRRAQGKAEPGIQQHERQKQPSPVKQVDDPEEQENTFAEAFGEAGTQDHVVDDSVLLSASDSSSPLVAAKRGSRPSLSDRTALTLAQVPPTPGSDRRRSAFFNPHSPMTPARPDSALSVSKLSYSSIRGMPKPTPSTLSRNARAPQGYTPRRSISSNAVPSHLTSSTARRPPMPPPSVSRPASAAPMLGRPSLLRQATAPKVGGTVRPATTIATSITARATATSTTSIAARPTTAFGRSVRGLPPKTIQARPASQLSQSVNSTRRISNMGPPSKVNVKPSAAKSTSSAALRSQISAARASHRVQQDTRRSVEDFDPDGYKDPFGQGTTSEEAPLLRRLEKAREDGRLNIAAMGFKKIPDEVLTMYDAGAMQQSSLAWNETVDLTYFNAADNEIDKIDDEIFPDMTMEQLAEMSDSKGNQFGGLETLDLHGNMLRTIPLGIRRLGRLTTLNLSRNNLTNDVFSILSELPYLRHLYLASNDLSRVLPDSIAHLDSLETLDLSDNKLVLLPPCIHHLTNLRILNISSNRFSDLSLDALATLPALAEVYASKNALTGSLFPSTVTILPSLRILDVSKNSIASLAWASTTTSLSLPALTYLNISHNRLIALPNLSTWTNLTSLLAEENAITTPPPGFTDLQQLHTVIFTSNDIKVLDDRIAGMRSLETLEVAGNPLREKRFLTMGTEVLKREMSRRLALTEVMDAEGKGGALVLESAVVGQEDGEDEMF